MTLSDLSGGEDENKNYFMDLSLEEAWNFFDGVQKSKI